MHYIHNRSLLFRENWPSCMEKKSCGPPPKFPVNSALRAKDSIIEVPDSAVFKCKENGKVTDLGKTIEIQVLPAI